MDISSNQYFTDLLDKFNFIEGVWITDIEGNLLGSSIRGI
jgi:hypothetical protein